MSEEEKKPFWKPNFLYSLKNSIGALLVSIGLIVAISFWIPLYLIIFFYGGNEGANHMREFIDNLKIDVGLAILLGSTIISGAILLSGIRKEKNE